jgi:FAD binding domain
MNPPDYWAQRQISAPEDAVRLRRLEHIRALRSAGRFLSEYDEGWDLARRAWNLAADQRPPHVAFPETVDDVMAVVAYAGANGLRVAPQGTGHGAAPLGSIEDALLLRPTRMRGIQIDPARRRARVGAGVTWSEVQKQAAIHGLAGLAGSSPDVGVLGFTLGGGLGWLGRRYGLACNSVLAFDVVTADGRLLRVDHEHEPELFWALRGGGGSFGIVTAIEFALYPVRDLYAGAMFWPQERAAEVLHAWRQWTATVPDSVTSVGRLLNLPAAGQVPEGLRGRSFVLVEAACLTTEVEGAELTRSLRDLGPEIDTFSMLPPTGLGALHMDPVEPVAVSIDGWLMADLPPAAIDALVGAAGPGSGSPLLSLEVRHLGGALGNAAPQHGALASLEGRFATVAIGAIPTAQDAAAVERRSTAVRAALAPWAAERNYANFAGPSARVSDFHSGATFRRLARVKAEYDPHDLIRSAHPVPAS